jgi:hypothetical protein
VLLVFAIMICQASCDLERDRPHRRKKNEQALQVGRHTESGTQHHFKEEGTPVFD